MAFGTLKVSMRDPKPVREKQKKEKPVPQEKEPVHVPVNGRDRLKILVIGRNMAMIQEFLCAMNENMSEALQTQGLAFYTQELQTISDVVAKKKKLEQFLWSFSKQDWCYSEEDTHEKKYVFSISPSGDQQKAIDLELQCITPDAETNMSWAQTDALWLLSDGALVLQEYDGFLSYLRDVLAGLPEQSADEKKPICLIQTQIESLGHFSGVAGMSRLPEKVERSITQMCRAQFVCDAPVAIIPVQVYGGMEFVGLDDNHMPKLHIGQSGFYQSYIPDNGHVPVLFTLQSICADKQEPVFTGINQTELLKSIRNHFGKKFGNVQWAPYMLNEEEGAE